MLPDRPASNVKKRTLKQYDNVVMRLNNVMNDEAEKFCFYEVDLSKLLLPYMKNGLLNEMVRLNAHVSGLVRILDVRRPTAVFSQHALGSGYALGELCNRRNIPAMLVSHGSHVPQENKYARIEWGEHARTLLNTDYPFVAAQTPWALKFFDGLQEVSSKLVITGPLLLAKRSGQIGSRLLLRRKLFSDISAETIIIQAGTPKPRSAIRPWVYETIDEYISNINDLIRAVEQIPGMYLVVRFRASSALTSVNFKQLLIKAECYGVYEDGSFEEYLLASDLLVSYSSTTIEEALQNQIPVLQYDPDDKYCHIPAQSIKRDDTIKVSPVYYTGDCEDLVYALEWINTQHIQGEKPQEASWAKHAYAEKNPLEWLSEMGVS